MDAMPEFTFNFDSDADLKAKQLAAEDGAHCAECSGDWPIVSGPNEDGTAFMVVSGSKERIVAVSAIESTQAERDSIEGL